jgi:hypothetical protein
MNTMSEISLPFTLEGADEDGGAVMLNDLRAFIKTLSDCLQIVEKRELGTTGLRHRIADMKVSSAYMKLVPAPKKKTRAPEAGRVVYEKFEETVSDLEAGRPVDAKFRKEDLKEFRKLAQLTLGGKKKVQVAGVQLSTQFVANIDKLLGSVIKSKGTVKGRVEKLNVHDRHEFTLYPPIGDCSIVCTFKEHLFGQVQSAIKQNVTVTGTLSFRPDSPYPEMVQVDFIDIHPSDDALPKLADLRGLMPDATNGKPVVEFLRAIRDE